jgi:hypothetical protein
MLAIASPIIDWSAILKIVIAALVGGCGIVVVFGFLLLGIKYAGVGDETGATHTETNKLTGYALATICGLLVLAVIALGIYAMTQKS